MMLCRLTFGGFAYSNSHVVTSRPTQAKIAEKAATEAQEKIDSQALPIRAYLDQTVVPILLQGLSDLVKARCVPTARISTFACFELCVWIPLWL